MLILYVQSEKSGQFSMGFERGEGITLVVSMRELVAVVWWYQRQCPVLRAFV